MAQTSPLSSLDAETTATEDTGTGALPGATVKAPTSKSGLSVPGSLALDESQTNEILKRMQEMLDARHSPIANMNAAIERGMAIGAPNLGGAAALNTLNTRLNEEAKQEMEMRSQMAALRASQARNKLTQQNLLDAYGKAHPKAETGTGTEGTATSQSIVSNAMPEAMWNDYLRATMSGDYAGAEKILRDWNASAAKQKYKAETEFEANPSSQKQELYTVQTPNGVTQVNMDPVQWRRAKATGKLPDGTPIILSAAQQQQKPAPAAVNAPTANLTVGESGGIPESTGFGAHIGNIFGREGGYKAQDGNGAPVNFGINQKANPDIDVKNLTKERASQLYKERYWDPIGADKLAPDAAEIAFDAAVNQGTAYAKNLIQQTGGDPAKMLAQRKRDYVNLVTKNPAQVKNLQTWLDRLDDVANKAQDFRTSATTTTNQAAQTVQNAQAPSPAAPVSAPSSAAPAAAGANEAAAIQRWSGVHAPQNSAQFEQMKSDIAKAREADISLASDITKEGAKAKISGVATESQKAADAAAHMEELAKNANEVSAAADRIANHAKSHPTEFGKAKQSNISGIVLGGLESVLPSVEHGIENVIANVHPDKDAQGRTQSDRRNTTDADAGKIGFAAASELFAGSGARLGVGLEQMVARTKGVGTEHSAETNLINSTLIKLAAQKSKELAPYWTAYKNAKPLGDANFYEFIQSDPNAIRIEKKYDPAFKQWLDSTKTISPEYYNDLTKKPDIKSFYKKAK